MFAWHQVPRSDLQGLQLVQSYTSQSGSQHTVWCRIRVALKTAKPSPWPTACAARPWQSRCCNNWPKPPGCRYVRADSLHPSPAPCLAHPHPPRPSPAQILLTRGGCRRSASVWRRCSCCPLWCLAQPAAVRCDPTLVDWARAQQWQATPAIVESAATLWEPGQEAAVVYGWKLAFATPRQARNTRQRASHIGNGNASSGYQQLGA